LKEDKPLSDAIKLKWKMSPKKKGNTKKGNGKFKPSTNLSIQGAMDMQF
jgi:hypothetical protein